ncbi:hypothetical protein, partial [Rhodococcus sp. A5(2022)]|uniref:hypothetical protein n=1 Tax=Rhodococcus sp. A5(2022) TaxID=3003588 RepID=UPI0022A83A20
AIHLGANKVLVVGAGRMTEPAPGAAESARYPSLAQIAGHALSSIFLDGLAVDIERLNRINLTLSMLPPELLGKTALRPVELLVIAWKKVVNSYSRDGAMRGSLDDRCV